MFIIFLNNENAWPLFLDDILALCFLQFSCEFFSSFLEKVPITTSIFFFIYFNTKYYYFSGLFSILIKNLSTNINFWFTLQYLRLCESIRNQMIFWIPMSIHLKHRFALKVLKQFCISYSWIKQGSKGIRQGLINWCVSQILKLLDAQLNEPTN